MISSCVLLRRRSSLVISLPAKISSNSDLLRRCLLQRRSPPATSAPATISLLRRLLQRRSPSSDVSSSDDLLRLPPCRPVSSLPNLQCLPFVLDQQGSGKALVSLINQKKWTGTIMDKSLSGSSSSVSSNELELMQMNRCMMHCLQLLLRLLMPLILQELDHSALCYQR
nr:uncharacterized protein LOC112791020 isoform X3 [Arachis hypogaea]XP_025689478.1 uncharacterized protein LOC112791020 isoform X3 [Arachis hypogaea]XP_025689479.1 uncharacterized protein LOC112791020 isoform X3 [Arachis hypogaea]